MTLQCRITEEDLTLQVLCDKSSTNALRVCQDEQSCCNLLLCSLKNEAARRIKFFRTRKSFSPDLNPLDYYVWSAIERVTNKSRRPRDISPGRYRGGIHQYGQGRVAESMLALQAEDRSNHRNKRGLYRVILL